MLNTKLNVHSLLFFLVNNFF